MKDFLQKLKKFLKIALIVVIVIFVAVGLITAFDNHQRKFANTIDEEIGFVCDGIEEDKYMRFILASTPNSRDTAKFYASAYVLLVEKSEESETAYARLVPWTIKERTIDFIHIENSLANVKFKLNRKTFDLDIYTRENGIYLPEPIPTKCEQIEPQDIKDKVKETNAKADAENKI